MFINMKKILAMMWTFELLLHFDQLFSSKLRHAEKLGTNHKYNHISFSNIF